MTRMDDLHEEWSKDPGYRAACARLETEHALASLRILVRTLPPLTQAELVGRKSAALSTEFRPIGSSIHEAADVFEGAKQFPGSSD